MIDSPVNFAPHTALGRNRTAMRSILFLCVLDWTSGGVQEVLKGDMSSPWRDAVAYRMPDDGVLTLGHEPTSRRQGTCFFAPHSHSSTARVDDCESKSLRRKTAKK